MTLICEICGGEITDKPDTSSARLCLHCRYISRRQDRVPHYCRRCGAVVTDRAQHKNAKLCQECRVIARRVGFDLLDRYIPEIEKYLNDHRWPAYINARKMVDIYPDILTAPEIKTQYRKQQIVAAIIRKIRDPDGRHYMPYNTQQYVLTEADA
jgi:hypothetical protein